MPRADASLTVDGDGSHRESEIPRHASETDRALMRHIDKRIVRGSPLRRAPSGEACSCFFTNFAVITRFIMPLKGTHRLWTRPNATIYLDSFKLKLWG